MSQREWQIDTQNATNPNADRDGESPHHRRLTSHVQSRTDNLRNSVCKRRRGECLSSTPLNAHVHAKQMTLSSKGKMTFAALLKSWTDYCPSVVRLLEVWARKCRPSSAPEAEGVSQYQDLNKELAIMIKSLGRANICDQTLKSDTQE